MKKSFSIIVISCVFILGLAVICYPTFSNYYNSLNSSKAISTYNEATVDMGENDYNLMIEEARAFNDSLPNSLSTFSMGDELYAEYQSVLNVTNGMMGYIIIDKIGVSLPIYHGTTETVLQVGVGHLEGSDLPTGDEGNHTILTGHTGLPSATLFTDLDQLELDDTFELLILEETLTYEVTNIEVVLPSEVDLLEREDGSDMVTLVTCTPYGINSHRLLVQAQRVEVEDIPEIEQSVQTSNKNYDRFYIISIIILIPTIIILLIVLIKSMKNKKRY